MLSTAEQLTPDFCQNRLRITMPDRGAGSAGSPVEVLAWCKLSACTAPASKAEMPITLELPP